MSAPRIVLYGNFGIGNLGNDSTLEAALVAIRQYQPQANLLCVCTGPSVVAEQYGVPVYPVSVSHAARAGRPRGRVARIVDRILGEVAFWLRPPDWLRSSDKFIVVGTGSLDDMGERPWGAPYDILRWCAAARLARVPVVFLSVGAGPIVNPVSRLFMLWALRLGRYRSYRDQVSKDFLFSAGLDASLDPVVPDLVFGLPADLGGALRAVRMPPRTVGLGVMGYYGWRLDPRSGEPIYAAYLAKLKEFVRWLLERGYAIRLLTGQLPADQQPVDDLLDYVRTAGPAAWQERVTAGRIESIGDLFTEIAQTDVVVATRYHNVVCALMLGRPVISLGYARKNDFLLSDMGLQAYCQHVETFTVAKLIQQFEALAAELEAASARIQAVNLRFRQQLDEQYAAILQPARAAEPLPAV